MAGYERIRNVLPGFPQAFDQRLSLAGPFEHAAPAPEQGDLLLCAELPVVFQVVGNPQQEVGDGDFTPQGLGKDPDPHREGAAGGDEKFLERGHGGLSAPGHTSSTSPSARAARHHAVSGRTAQPVTPDGTTSTPAVIVADPMVRGLTFENSIIVCP